MDFAIVRPAGQVTAPSSGFSTPTKIVMTVFVLGFFAFAYSASKEAETKASRDLERARRDYAKRHYAAARA